MNLKQLVGWLEQGDREVTNVFEDFGFTTIGQVSDGYHTFDELYYHRMVLFAIICNQNPLKAWKSKLHHEGDMYENYFIVGITTPKGDYSYHYHKEFWDMFVVRELERAPKWDGHKPEDIKRLFSLPGSHH
ncbi:hypothetical protein M3_0135 [Lysinibacillus phage vB_LfM_LysYB1]|nr:hypothetical protein M3_0135 [Lysinibacillus phage vB_LfM_LysYB1]WAB25354.1 hypothetical protein M5_0176 [Lysinibacillus phage vB_LfM_LysYB2]